MNCDVYGVTGNARELCCYLHVYVIGDSMIMHVIVIDYSLCDVHYHDLISCDHFVDNPRL